MTEKICNAVNKLGEQLSCPICFENYSTPKTLFCLHTFCQQCLECLPVDPERNVTCPTCRSPCELPDSGVAGLPTAFFVENLAEVHSLLRKAVGNEPVLCGDCCKNIACSYCKQCASFFCPNCIKPHSKLEQFSRHCVLSVDEMATAATSLSSSQLVRCSAHDQPLDMYCNTCHDLICSSCVVKIHREHSHNHISDAYLENRDALETSLKLVENQIPKLTESRVILLQRRKDIVQCSENVRQEVNSTVTEVIELLNRYRTKLLDTIEVSLKQKLATVNQQIDEIETTLAGLEDCSGFVKEVLTRGNAQQVLANKKQMINHAKSLVQICTNETFDPLEEADFKFSRPKTGRDVLDIVGQLNYHLNVLPHSVSTSYQHIPLVGRESTVSLTFSSSDGSPIPLSVSLIQCHLTPPNGDQKIECTLRESSVSGQYDITFTPYVRGTHSIHVSVRKTKVPSSPLTIPVSILPEMRGIPQDVITDLEKPWGVSIADNGQVVISEWEGTCLSLLECDGMRKMKYIGGIGSEPGQFSNPTSVAMTQRGTFLVSDTSNNRIQEISMNGKCLACVGSQGEGPLEFWFPRGIAINKKTQRVYIADDENHRIQVLNSDLSFHSTFGSAGVGRGQLNRPRDVVFDSTGNLYVTDVGNNHILKFSPDGECLATFGKRGSKPGQLNLPVGITIDDNDQIYVSESGNHRISVFSATGDFICCFSGWPNGGNQLSDPRELEFDRSGRLYVCDWSKCCVIVF